MLLKIPKSSRAAEGGGGSQNNKKCVPFKKSSSKLYQKGVRILVKRAPVMAGLTVKPVSTAFQRPMTKRRAYDKSAEAALKTSSLGPKRRLNGMAKLLARAGKPLTFKLPTNHRSKTSGSDTEGESDEDEEEEEKQDDKPFEPLEVWTSPHQGGECKGLPPVPVTDIRPDEYGIEEEVTVLKPPPASAYAKKSVLVPEVLAKFLRPHQREGVQFMYECVMGLRNHANQGCILADDMGLGKTLMSITLIYTLLKTGVTADGAPTCKRVIVVCPCSLVKNWENEIKKWLKDQKEIKVLGISEADRKKVIRDLDCFVSTKIFNVLIVSYECIRAHIKRIIKKNDCCDLLVCDEAHRLKNSENQTSRALNSLPVRRRVLLTGTPMQNDLGEFFAMVDFTNRYCLGSVEEFRKNMLFPILRGREPDATEAQKRKMVDCQGELSNIVDEFILRRTNTINAKHLPPKLVQVVCINLTDIQKNMYEHLVNSKATKHILDGKQVNCLGSIQALMKLSNHPSLVVDDDTSYKGKVNNNKRSTAKQVKYNDDDEKETAAVPGADGIARFLPSSEGGGRGGFGPVHPEWSGKMYVLYRLMKEMRKPGNGADKIVIISNYTQTLDLIGRMCKENSWGACRLDGSVSMKKRQKMVDDFNDPSSSLIAFLLSSKAGGCGLNLIGGNRLVLFDPDWNPAVDKQAAARCWRDGQKKRCFTYRFLATGTVEEKIFQRQLSKEGLQSVVDDKEQVNALATKDLRNLFKLRQGTPSDTHDKLRCERCKIIHDNAELEASKVLPKKLVACRELLDEMVALPDAQYFLKPLDATLHGHSKEEYEKLVKQPMDFETIGKKLAQPPGNPSAYAAVSGFSKDVNRIFSNVAKVWNEGEDDIADASKRLQTWWLEKWIELVPCLMSMKADDENEKKDEPKDAVASMLETFASANVDNERGEDYQEQIGMPDEENMRHWSHHHSTDTVDDPVFRAAMRNTDAVSFVFGLEVTWNLIEQRQNDEEEQAAMQALENVEEQEQEEEDDSNGDEEEDEDDDSKPAAKPSSKDVAMDENGGDGDTARAKKRAKKSVIEDDEEDSEDDDDGDEEMNDFIVKDEEEEDGGSDNDEAVVDDDEEEDGDDDDNDDDKENDVVVGSDDEQEEKASGKTLVDSDDDDDDDDEEEEVVGKSGASQGGNVLVDSDDDDDDEDGEVSKNGASQSADALVDSDDNDDDENQGDKKTDGMLVDSDDEDQGENEGKNLLVNSSTATNATKKEEHDEDSDSLLDTPAAQKDTVMSMDDDKDDEDSPEPVVAETAPGSAKTDVSTPCIEGQLADSSPDTVQAEACNDDYDPSPSPPPKEELKPGEWECSACTYVNPASKARKCKMCNTKKPPAPRSRKRARS